MNGAGVSGGGVGKIHAITSTSRNHELGVDEHTAACGKAVARLGGDATFDPAQRNACQACAKKVGGAAWRP